MGAPVGEETGYLSVSDKAGREFFMRGIQGPIVMLNLLRFREIADYSDFPDLKPAQPISGHAAFARYIEHTRPFLAESGGSIRFLGHGGPWLIGPDGEKWDMAMLIE